MSAAVARRKKQLAAKAALASKNGTDPITDKLQSLLAPSSIDESTAYEALQLAQSQVRKCVKSHDFEKATVTYGHDICLSLLSAHQKASVASQLLALLVQVLTETHTRCDDSWIARIQELHKAYLTAVQVLSSKVEQKRLYKLHSKFLKSVLSWSEALGDLRLGRLELHQLLADHSWFLSEYLAGDDAAPSPPSAIPKAKDDDDASEEFTTLALQSAAVTHYALAEQPTLIASKLSTLDKPTDAQIKYNHTCPPAARDALLTRSILVFATVENLRDATTLLTSYMNDIEERSMDDLTKQYLPAKAKGGKNKNAEKPKYAPSHVIFSSMLLSILQKDKKTGPLYTWLLKAFDKAEIAKMHKADLLRGYTTKIGKMYFDIQPPPSMMDTIENMMSMMGGGGLGGPGGPGGMGGMNPAMMQAMMGGMGGGGF